VAIVVVIRGIAIDCQKSVVTQRQHGIDVDVRVVNTKTAAARRLDPNGTAWYAADTVVEALWCNYVHHSRIRIAGDAGACDYKVRLGGASAGSSGLIGATSDSDITLDLGGTAATSDIVEVDSGGNTIVDTRLTVSKRTASSLPTAFYLASLNNRLLIGSSNTGSFTGTLTGCTTSPTGTIKWTLDGGQVTLSIPQITGTSNSTGATITGMPEQIRPGDAVYPFAITTDNGTSVASRLAIGTNGTITLNKVASSTFTNSGTKGIEACSVTYRIGA